MFFKDSTQVYRCPELEAFEWLEHGFGSRFSPTFGRAANVATLHQIHSNIVVEAGGRSGLLGEGDALIENSPGHLIAIKTADCLPVVIVDPENRAVAAAHAGWRGTAQQIVQQTVAGMAEKFSSRAEQLHAAIGPGIGACCYEVGPEVAEKFSSYPGRLTSSGQGIRLDLAGVNWQQLVDAGLDPGRIYVAGLCTMCNPEFHSYRRDRQQAGRMMSAVGVR